MQPAIEVPEGLRGTGSRDRLRQLRPPRWWSSDEWETPPKLIAELEAEFGRFDLDPCCRQESAKARRFFTRDVDGLAQQWRGRVFVNPPYSNPRPWLAKAAAEVGKRAEIVVVLLPACTDTGWFHELVQPFAEIRWIRGRVLFHGWRGTPIDRPRNPNFLAIYRPAVQSLVSPQALMFSSQGGQS